MKEKNIPSNSFASVDCCFQTIAGPVSTAWETEWPKFLEVGECLSRPLADKEVRWQLGDTVRQFGTRNNRMDVWRGEMCLLTVKTIVD